MSLLLDTHVVLWWLADDPGLPEEIKDRLDHEPDVRVSAATIWEIAIKQALGKISAPADLPDRVRDSGFRELPVDFTHAIAAGRLPLIHRWPVSRADTLGPDRMATASSRASSPSRSRRTRNRMAGSSDCRRNSTALSQPRATAWITTASLAPARQRHRRAPRVPPRILDASQNWPSRAFP